MAEKVATLVLQVESVEVFLVEVITITVHVELKVAAAHKMQAVLQDKIVIHLVYQEAMA